MRRHRAQDGGPLHVVDLAADHLVVRQQHVVFDVEDARGVVGALEEGAELVEVEGVVAQDGVEQRAAEQRRALLDPVEQRRQLVGVDAWLASMAENSIQALLRLSHISRVSAVRCARALRRAVARHE